MRLNNETEYRTREIKKLLTATHNFVAKFEDRLPQWSGVVFRIAYTKSRVHSGHAYLNGHRSTLRFRPPNGRKWWDGERLPNDSAKAGDVVRLGYHELMHLYGYRHEQMPRYYPTKDEIRSICEDADMEPSTLLPTYAEPEPKDKSTTEKQVERYRRRLNQLKDWTSKARRAKTYLDKYHRSARYYERQLEEAGVDTESIRDDVLGDYEPATPADMKGV